MMQYYREQGETFEDFDECYQKFGDDWNGGKYMKNIDGKWVECSTYNPDSKWDWYVEGGRWSSLLKLRDGTTASSAKKFQIQNLEEIETFAVLMHGRWYEKGTMGWWCHVSNAMGKEEWSKKWHDLIESVSEDERLTIVDCHI